jgi:wyosine [tRNA(Phe)-imidazoG37] synthetase (radical SAM superfamily)
MNALLQPSAQPLNAKGSTPFSQPRDYRDHRYVYLAVSPRARGLSIGVNLSPDRKCNFACAYCDVDRREPGVARPIDLNALASELQQALAFVRSGKVREHAPYTRMPSALTKLAHVTISGDGEPTLSPQFREALETVVHLRATTPGPFFKIVLITNASNLDAPEVREGLRLLTRDDEVWAKLDGGTQAYLERVNHSEVPLSKILANILQLAKHRRVVIQSLFPSINGCAPSEAEITQYAERLKELKEAGAQISLVQIYSATRPTPNSECSHLPLRTLSRIAQTVRAATGLNAEVF